MLKKGLQISVVMPCLNEEKTVGECVRRAKAGLKKARVEGEVVVCDNGSEDQSAKLAQKAGARVVYEFKRGYGSAYLAGIEAAKGEWLVLGDSDGTYDFREIPKFLNQLGVGYDLVIGSRLKGKIGEKAMPTLNRFVGTPILNLFLRLFYQLKISDSQSGMRALTKKAFRRLHLGCLGMEFASEMLIRAAQKNFKIKEVPISYHRRLTPSKLSRFRDAWRHFRFMLLFAPTWLFLIPGTLLMGIGLLGVFLISRAPIFIFGQGLDFHTMIFASMLTLLGYQVIMLGIYAQAFSWTQGFNQGSLLIETTLRYFRLEKGIILGTIISLIGFLVGLVTLLNWAQQGFGALWAIRPAILAMTLFILGIQIVFSSFFLSVMGIERR